MASAPDWHFRAPIEIPSDAYRQQHHPHRRGFRHAAHQYGHIRHLRCELSPHREGKTAASSRSSSSPTACTKTAPTPRITARGKCASSWKTAARQSTTSISISPKTAPKHPGRRPIPSMAISSSAPPVRPARPDGRSMPIRASMPKSGPAETVLVDSIYTDGTPHTGQYSYLLGLRSDTDPGDAYPTVTLSRTITVPTSAPGSLTLRYRAEGWDSSADGSSQWDFLSDPDRWGYRGGARCQQFRRAALFPQLRNRSDQQQLFRLRPLQQLGTWTPAATITWAWACRRETSHGSRCRPTLMPMPAGPSPWK